MYYYSYNERVQPNGTHYWRQETPFFINQKAADRIYGLDWYITIMNFFCLHITSTMLSSAEHLYIIKEEKSVAILCHFTNVKNYENQHSKVAEMYIQSLANVIIYWRRR